MPRWRTTRAVRTSTARSSEAVPRQPTPIERVQEAEEPCRRLKEQEPRLRDKELEFVNDITERLERFQDDTFVSPKQIFWLRDIYQRLTDGEDE